MFPPSIQSLISKLSHLPGVGPRTATRYVFYLLKLSQKELEGLAQDILSLKREIKTCKLCFNFYTGEGNSCQICLDSKRDKSILLAVEKETDVQQIEKTRRYNGLYFILGGTIFLKEKMDLNNLRLRDLEQRVENNNLKEVILGFNPTVEGDATALYLKKQIKNWVGEKIKVTRLGRGLPIGGELEYADEETLSQALDGRK